MLYANAALFLWIRRAPLTNRTNKKDGNDMDAEPKGASKTAGAVKRKGGNPFSLAPPAKAAKN
jgi:hypothetical protein